MNFLYRLGKYYASVGETLAAQAKTAAIFDNRTDIGITREHIYLKLLTGHIPARCQAFLGGSLFDANGQESKQIDIIVTTDTTPRFLLPGAGEKSFAPVEGSLAAVSVKSSLDKAQLVDSLDCLASIPATRPLGDQKAPHIKIPNYDDWPLKIVYAHTGIAGDTLLHHINEYYAERPHIPAGRRANFIHVAGQYFVFRADGSLVLPTVDGVSHGHLPSGGFYGVTAHPDLQGIMWTLDELQSRANASAHILFSYRDLWNNLAARHR